MPDRRTVRARCQVLRAKLEGYQGAISGLAEEDPELLALEMKKFSGKLTDAQQRMDFGTLNYAKDSWLEELQDLAYDLDDSLDEFATKQIKRTLEGALPPRRYNNSHLSVSMSIDDMKSKLKEITTLLKYITEESSDFYLRSVRQRTPTTSLIHEPKVCGRDEDIKKITEFLLGDGESIEGNDKIGVISIVGMAGIGKTTVAQAVYNDENVKSHFNLRVWICVSNDFNVMRITKTILESVTSKKCDFTNLDQVQRELREIMVCEKFLIVLDGIWQKNNHDWSVLKSTFCDAARGSKVIVTTRDINVASLMGSPQHRQHFLEPLPFEDCWSVFAQHAFEDRNMNENENLVNIGKDIVRKCKGLPLSARVLGGLLRGKEFEFEWRGMWKSELMDVVQREWIDVVQSECWRWKDNRILPSLWLSYHHLPSYLKRCFAYCSIFPKDYIFGKDELVLLWIAEGLVQQGRENMQLEDIGREYFHELLSRSFFQFVDVDSNKKSFLMHDLMHDFARDISGDLCFRLDDKQPRNLARARYLSVWERDFGVRKNYESVFEAKRLRTFLPFSSCSHLCSLTEKDSTNFFLKLTCLRTLSLRHYVAVRFPDSIGDLKHLRYLDLSFTDIETLPDWVQNLYNLQTLILRECKKLTSLPKNMGNLINLRFFDVTNADLLTEMPLGIGNMKSLHMLSNFIVTKDEGFRIRELGELRHIEETLCISGLHNVIDHKDAKGARIIEKQHLSILIMDYDANSDAMPNDKVERVLDMLRPHNNIKELTIRRYHGTKFPPWLGSPDFTNMVHIKIQHCRNCSVLPTLGHLKSLKKLYIQGMTSVKYVGREFYGLRNQKPFPSLETLSFKDMPEWKDWFTFGVEDKIQPFAHVKQVYIKGCPRLVSLFSEEIDGESGERQQKSEAVQSSMRRLELLMIEDCGKLEKLPRGLYMLTNLVELYINECHNLVSLPDKGFPSTLRSLTIHLCGALESPLPLWNKDPHLETLDLYGCQSLTYLISSSSSSDNNSSRMGRLPQSLKFLNIDNCRNLEALFAGEDENKIHCPSLEDITINGCSRLKYLPDTLNNDSLRKLKNLSIWGCGDLQGLPGGWVDAITSRDDSIKGGKGKGKGVEMGSPLPLGELSPKSNTPYFVNY